MSRMWNPWILDFPDLTHFPFAVMWGSMDNQFRIPTTTRACYPPKQCVSSRRLRVLSERKFVQASESSFVEHSTRMARAARDRSNDDDAEVSFGRIDVDARVALCQQRKLSRDCGFLRPKTSGRKWSKVQVAAKC